MYFADFAVAAHDDEAIASSPLLFNATGFQSTDRTVTVTEGSPTYVNVYGPSGFEGRSCGCATVNQQSITIELTPGIAMERLGQRLRLREPRRVL